MSNFVIYTIDDDVDFNVVLKMAMKNYGVEIKTHTDSKAFTESVKVQKPDLCILDLNLESDGEGFELLSAMRNVIGVDLPIFVMSKRGSSEDVLKAMERGANDFIPKPLDDKYLILKLKEYMPNNRDVQLMDHTYSRVPEEDREISLLMKFRVVKIGIDLLEIEGEEFLTKNMNLSIGGDIIQNIFDQESLNFKVIEGWQIDETRYGAKLEKELNPEQLFSLRRWLTSQGSKDE